MGAPTPHAMPCQQGCTARLPHLRATHPPTPHPHHLLPPGTTLEGHVPCLPRGRASSPPGPNSPPTQPCHLLGSHASCCPLAHVGVWWCVVTMLGLIPLGRVVQQACMPRDGCPLTLFVAASHLYFGRPPSPQPKTLLPQPTPPPPPAPQAVSPDTWKGGGQGWAAGWGEGFWQVERGGWVGGEDAKAWHSHGVKPGPSCPTLPSTPLPQHHRVGHRGQLSAPPSPP